MENAKYFHKKKLNVPIYDTKLILIITNNDDEIKKYDKDFDDNELYAQTWTVYGKGIFIGLNFNHSTKSISAGVVAHEGIHATNFILHDRGVIADFENDEPVAYLLNWIVDEIHKFAEEKQMKIK